MLLGLNLPSQPTFALVLIGDEYLLGQLQLRNHRALCSRLGAIICSPLESGGDPDLSQNRAGSRGINRSKVFEPAAVDLLVRATAGVPRSALPPGPSSLVGSSSSRSPGNQRPDHAVGHGTGAGVNGPHSPHSMIQRIQQAHALYCQLTGQRVSLRFDRERLWYELFHAASMKPTFKVIRYLQREIREGRRNVGALKLSNLLQIDRFEEDLNISRVQLYAPKPPPPSPTSPAPPPTPEQKEAARQRALQLLAKLRAEQGLWPPRLIPKPPPPTNASPSPGSIPGDPPQSSSPLSHRAIASFSLLTNSLICPVAPQTSPRLTPQNNSLLYSLATLPRIRG
ncbi:MAG: hypothetical protein U1G07_08955 [Verrucomicrobiota bacterium]